MNYLTNILRKQTPQTEPLTGQVRNSDIGHSWATDDWTRLDRFLVLGSEGGSFYAGERELTRENARAVERCILADGERAVDTIVGIAAEGRAPKHDPALFALAMATGIGDEKTRRAALDAVPKVCRTGTHLFRFVSYAEGFRGWGRGLRRAVGRWYVERELDSLAYQVVKYRQRDGWSHRDLLRLAHPGTKGRNPAVIVPAGHARLFDWIAHGGDTAGLPDAVGGFVRAQRAETAGQAAELVRSHRLPREALQPEHLRAPEVWDALLDDMPMTALIRNLATMTRVGVVTPGSERTETVIAQLEDTERLRSARVHPIAVLAALRTYASGHSARGTATWTPVTQVIDALDAAFYAAFGNVESTGQRTLLALDVSGSMSWGEVAGVPGLTPRDASAAMALVTAATEPRHEIVGFTHGLTPLAIGPRQRLDDAIRTVSDLPFGATDCSQPMLWAAKHKREIDTFVIYTDSETWAGNVHPAVALDEYRRRSGIDSRLVVVGMVSNGFTIADPNDPGMLDVVGFDAATPELIAGFSKRSF
jgi:60 kDa SS-A/Ro ribonucleoprotein